jgi:hypothetical protein
LIIRRKYRNEKLGERRTLIHLREPSWRNHRTLTGQFVNVHHVTHRNNLVLTDLGSLRNADALRSKCYG